MVNEITTVFDTETYMGCQVNYRKVRQISITETLNDLLKNHKSLDIKRIVLQKISKSLEKFEERPWNDN